MLRRLATSGIGSTASALDSRIPTTRRTTARQWFGHTPLTRTSRRGACRCVHTHPAQLPGSVPRPLRVCTGKCSAPFLFAFWVCHLVSMWARVCAWQGWPKLLFQVWQLDEAGRADVCGYGFCNVPPGPGSYNVRRRPLREPCMPSDLALPLALSVMLRGDQVECRTWRPCGTEHQELFSHYLGGRPQLKSTGVITCDASERFHLSTIGSGTVRVCCVVVLCVCCKERAQRVVRFCLCALTPLRRSIFSLTS